MTKASSHIGEVIIEARDIVKRFGGALAVENVSLAVREGEIHAVVGENGAGKSTLMRILAGIIEQDSGQVVMNGTVLETGAKNSLDAGIALVHQELSLVPEMTVAENIMLGYAPTRVGFTKSQELNAIATSALDEIGVSVDVNERISRLSVALRQFVEIARAVARKPKVLILDEPTATLTPAETDYLLDMLQRLAKNGMAIIYISHRIPEVFRICDSVTIVRDGQRVMESSIEKTTPEQIVDQMVGRELKLDLQTKRTAAAGDVVLSAQGIRAPGVEGIDLEVRAGEIVGLGGLVGAGRTELVRAIIGADNRTAGRVTITREGKTVTLTSYQSAVRNGVAYVPEERRTDGLALGMTVAENITLTNRKELSRYGVQTRSKIAKFSQDLADKVGLRPPEIRREAGQYSGGNQQKIVIAKWLGRRPDFIVLDEPTRGVDVGAKAEIHRLVKELADAGTAVLVVSSDLPELLELSDVIHVVRDGKITGTLHGAEASEKSVMSLAAGEKMVDA
ncbi:MAG: sugar ABC transporter ATP-binding protein [Microbacteriaceae bacterium]|jgi:ABC-type sugar transport system ATPase subunit|nr:sugar ABC transporter ATP-binding protein [Microbacteriaceae bacterium]MBT5617229.1 sugar ABC transporter ATP-binding protein [Microbacteriaceae bacterium]MBT5730424.1 sugar ABC transporter ATP-binding protein [Microbacteriaceae bacterium]